MTEDIRQKMERWKLLCEELESEHNRIFIKFLDELGIERWSSADILSVGEIHLLFQPFKGHGLGKNTQTRWVNILELQEYIQDVKKEEGDEE